VSNCARGHTGAGVVDCVHADRAGELMTAFVGRLWRRCGVVVAVVLGFSFWLRFHRVTRRPRDSGVLSRIAAVLIAAGGCGCSIRGPP